MHVSFTQSSFVISKRKIHPSVSLCGNRHNVFLGRTFYIAMLCWLSNSLPLTPQNRNWILLVQSSGKACPVMRTKERQCSRKRDSRDWGQCLVTSSPAPSARYLRRDEVVVWPRSRKCVTAVDCCRWLHGSTTWPEAITDPLNLLPLKTRRNGKAKRKLNPRKYAHIFTSSEECLAAA